MKPQEPSQKQKLAKNLLGNFKPLLLKNRSMDLEFVGLYPHYIGYALSCVQISAKYSHKRIQEALLGRSLKILSIKRSR